MQIAASEFDQGHSILARSAVRRPTVHTVRRPYMYSRPSRASSGLVQLYTKFSTSRIGNSLENASMMA
jgi:hypothetical protein